MEEKVATLRPYYIVFTVFFVCAILFFASPAFSSSGGWAPPPTTSTIIITQEGSTITESQLAVDANKDGVINTSDKGYTVKPNTPVSFTAQASVSSSTSAPAVDTDGDGIIDNRDNCIDVSNTSQLDTNSDGYGNMCDADYDNDGIVGLSDYGIFRNSYQTEVGSPGYNVDVDKDGDSIIAIGEFGLISAQMEAQVPGPSGLSCAGTIPCVATPIQTAPVYTYTYSWVFGDAGTGAIFSGQNVSHIYSIPGTYTLTFRVATNRIVSESRTIFIVVSTTGTESAGTGGEAVPSDYTIAIKPGILTHEAVAVLPVPHGSVNVMGGNIFIPSSYLSIGSLLGPISAGAVYNSADHIWRLSWESRMNSNEYVGNSGTIYPLKSVGGVPLYQSGDLIEGANLIYYDTHRLITKGGLIYDFDQDTGRLKEMDWLSSDRGAAIGQCGGVRVPRVVFNYEGEQIKKIEQCGTATCAPLFEMEHNGNGQVTKITRWADPEKDIDNVCNSFNCFVTNLLSGFVFNYFNSSGPFPYMLITYEGTNIASVRDSADILHGSPGKRFFYEGNNISKITDTNNIETSFSYYSGGQIRRIATLGAENPNINFVYKKANDTFYETDVNYNNTNHTIYRYGSNRLVESVEAIASKERIELAWDYAKKLIQTIQLRKDNMLIPGSSGSYEYNTYKDLTKARLGIGGGGEVLSTYEVQYSTDSAENKGNPSARPTKKIIIDGKSIDGRTYDSFGRLTSITSGDVSVADTPTIHFDYDSVLTGAYADNVSMCDFTALGNNEDARYKTYNAPMANQVVHYYEGGVAPLKNYILEPKDATITFPMKRIPSTTPLLRYSLNALHGGEPNHELIVMDGVAFGASPDMEEHWQDAKASWTIPNLEAGEYYIWAMSDTIRQAEGGRLTLSLGDDSVDSPYLFAYAPKSPSLFNWTFMPGSWSSPGIAGEEGLKISSSGQTQLEIKPTIEPYDLIRFDKILVSNYKEFQPLLWNGEGVLNRLEAWIPRYNSEGYGTSGKKWSPYSPESGTFHCPGYCAILTPLGQGGGEGFSIFKEDIERFEFGQVRRVSEGGIFKEFEGGDIAGVSGTKRDESLNLSVLNLVSTVTNSANTGAPIEEATIFFTPWRDINRNSITTTYTLCQGCGNILNASLSNNQYEIFNSSTDRIDYGFNDIDVFIQEGATIKGIEVSIEGYHSGTRNLTAALYNISNSNPDTFTSPKAALLGTTDSAKTLGGPNDLWGKTWTRSDFGGFGNNYFGYDFGIRIGATTGTGSAYLDRVMVKVYISSATPTVLTKNPPDTASVSFNDRADGALVEIERSGAGDTKFEYDSLGRLTKLKEQADGMWQESTVLYDTQGRIKNGKIPNGAESVLTYDTSHRVTNEKLIQDGVVEYDTSYEYSLDRLSKIKDEKTQNIIREYLYDSLGRLEKIVYADGEAIAFEYDSVYKTRIKKQRFYNEAGTLLRIILFTHDDDGRVIQISEGTSDTSIAPLVTYAYKDGVTEKITYKNGLEENLAGYTNVFGSKRTVTIHKAGEECDLTYLTAQNVLGENGLHGFNSWAYGGIYNGGCLAMSRMTDKINDDWGYMNPGDSIGLGAFDTSAIPEHKYTELVTYIAGTGSGPAGTGYFSEEDYLLVKDAENTGYRIRAGRIEHATSPQDFGYDHFNAETDLYRYKYDPYGNVVETEKQKARSVNLSTQYIFPTTLVDGWDIFGNHVILSVQEGDTPGEIVITGGGDYTIGGIHVDEDPETLDDWDGGLDVYDASGNLAYIIQIPLNPNFATTAVTGNVSQWQFSLLPVEPGFDEITYNSEKNRLLRARTLSGVETNGVYNRAPLDYLYDEAGYATKRGGDDIAWTAHGKIKSIGSSKIFNWDALGAPLSFILPY